MTRRSTRNARAAAKDLRNSKIDELNNDYFLGTTEPLDRELTLSRQAAVHADMSSTTVSVA